MAHSPFDRILEYPALTFDDVMLLPAASNLSDSDIKLATKFSQNITLQLPFVSAVAHSTMDMAIAMAQLGGIGIIPMEKLVSQQADKITKIKKFQARIVRDIMTVSADTPVIEALEVFARYGFPGLPVTNNDKTLAGVVMHDKIKDVDDVMQPVGNFMDKDAATLASSEAMQSGYDMMKQKNVSSLVIIDEKNHVKGRLTQGDKEKFDKYPLATVDDSGRLRAIAAVGLGPDHYDRIGSMIDAGADALYVEAANGHSKAMLDTVTHIRRQRAGHVDVIAGNVATADGARALIDAGANAVRAGIGAGSVCTARDKAGVYVPQLTAIMTVVDACDLSGVPVIADGGIRQSGDIAKALAAGASTVISGALLNAAFENKTLPDTLKELAEGVRLAMCYTGCATIDALRTSPQFIRVSKN